jgi:hypothetical protein
MGAGVGKTTPPPLSLEGRGKDPFHLFRIRSDHIGKRFDRLGHWLPDLARNLDHSKRATDRHHVADLARQFDDNA